MSWWKFWKRKKKTKSRPLGAVKTVGLIVGHTENAKGAWNYNKQIQEYDYWKEVVKFITLDKRFAIGFRDSGGVKGACSEIVKKLGKKPDVIIELHFNSYNGGAHGCEALYTNSKELAEKFCKFMAHKGCKNRGAKSVYVNGRGISNMEISSKYCTHSILTEMFFGDNQSDYIPIKSSREYLEEFINSL